MKKFLIIGTFISIAVILGLGFSSIGRETKKAEGITITQSVQKIQSHIATSTNGYIEENNAFFLVTGATSTMEFAIDGFSKALVGVHAVASTTASQLSFEVRVSGDSDAVAANDWYDFTPINLTTGAGTVDNGYLLATSTYATFTLLEGTSTVAFPVDLEEAVGRRMRVLVGAGGAASAVFLDVTLR